MDMEDADREPGRDTNSDTNSDADGDVARDVDRDADQSGRLRDLLQRVAAGDLGPAEAARLLDARPPEGGAAAPTIGHGRARIAGAVVTAHGVRLHVVADPAVATAAVDGPHLVREQDGRLMFELPGRREAPASDGSWALGRFRIDRPYGSGERATLRINPALPLRVDATACDVRISGLRGPLGFTCFSSSLQIADHRGALAGSMTTGSAKIEAELRGPADALTFDMSSLKLTLLEGSDTTITTRSELSSCKITGGRADPAGDVVVGADAGHGNLALALRMGSAKVVLP